MKKFADVILPLPLHSCFTYSLPDEWADGSANRLPGGSTIRAEEILYGHRA